MTAQTSAPVAGSPTTPLPPGRAPAGLRHGSACTGYAGLDMAVVEVLGGDLAWVADNDPGASAILAHRYPGVPNLGDITAADWSAVEPVGILTGGFPCTDVSCAGARAGLREGTRSGVWAHMAAAVGVLRPRLVVIENVRGLLSAGADSTVEPCPWCLGEGGVEHPLRASGAVLGDLADLGYDAEWVTVSAADAGAPHRRERVFIVAWPAADADDIVFPARAGGMASGKAGREWRDTGTDWRSGDRSQGPTPEDADGAARGQRRLPAPGQTAGGRPRADTRRPGGTPAPADTRGAGLEVRPVEHHGPQRPAAERGRGDDAPADAAGARHDRAEDARTDHSNAGTDRRWGVQPERGDFAPADASGAERRGPQQQDLGEAARRAAEPGERPGEAPADAPGQRRTGQHGPQPDMEQDGPEPAHAGTQRGAWGPYGPAIARWEAATGRRAPHPTEPGRTGERLSPAFVEWMMGLPEGWVTGVPGLTRNAQLKALGNGVVPQQAVMALRLLLGRVAGREAA